MDILISGLAFVTSATIVFCLGYLLTERGTLVRRYGPLEAGAAVERALVRLGRRVPKWEREQSRIEEQLVQAGYRSAAAPALFYGLSAASAALMAGLWGLCLFVSGRPLANSLMTLLAAALLGYLAPRGVLGWRVRARQEQLRRGLPPALDLMGVCASAGIGLDQTLATVSEHLGTLYPEMARELRQVILEMLAGRPRVEALHALARRTGVEEIRSFVRTLIQADRFGASISDSLGHAARELRLKRRQRAEEMAAKIPVKLIFPIFFFIFPAILVVTVAPAVLRLLRELLPMMRG